ncbi:MAG: hypothetical protein ACLQUY_21575 [Ktedonobacterales bacterium]
MSYFKLAEMVSGVGVTAVGLLGIIAAFLLPARSETVTISRNGQYIGQYQQNVWLLQELGTLRAASILATVGILAIIVAIASLLHVTQRLPIDLAALWGATLLLVGTVSITSQWTTYLFLPTAFLAVVAAVMATIYQLLSGNRKTPASP